MRYIRAEALLAYNLVKPIRAGQSFSDINFTVQCVLWVKEVSVE